MAMGKNIVSWVLVLVLVGAAAPSWAKKIKVLPELMRPEAMIVDQGDVFITQGIHIFVYSAADGTLTKKIGKEGEGPQEFRKFPDGTISSLTIFVTADRIIANNLEKVVFFKRTGEYIEELRTGMPINRFSPLGNKYAGMSMSREGQDVWIHSNLYSVQNKTANKTANKSMKLEKPIFRVKRPHRDGEKFNPIHMALLNKTYHYFSRPEILVIPDNDGSLHAFGKNGNRLFTIRHPFPKVKLTKKLEQQFDRFFLADIRYKSFYARDKASNFTKFPEHLPIIKEYRLADGKIYVVTNHKIKGKYETFIFDASNGKLLKTTGLPAKDMNVMELFPFDMDGGNVYQIVENDDEEWELHVSRIEK